MTRQFSEKMVPALAPLCRKLAAEGAVLLKNEGDLLPFAEGERISLFGRCQIDTYKSGTGSGGMVNAPYTYSILDGLQENGRLQLNPTLVEDYTAFCRENPPVKGTEWASDPWSHPEMPITDEQIATAAAYSDKAVVVIGRTAGEDKDASHTEGSFLLSAGEKSLLKAVTAAIPHVAVLLNVGNIIDMSWEEEFPVEAILYIWQGGMEGGAAVAELLTGLTPPSGRLSDTVALTYADHPSAVGFDREFDIPYTEDIYVGYRYFETFAPNRVRYPFGFGLSTTTFLWTTAAHLGEDHLHLTVTLQNAGKRAGREVVQIYAGGPQNELGRPTRTLIGFSKTRLLEPGNKQTLTIRIPLSGLAVYDECRSAYMLEAGDYPLYVGGNVRDAALVATHHQSEPVLIRQCEDILAPDPAKPFERLVAMEQEGTILPSWQPVPVRRTDPEERRLTRRPTELSPCNGNTPEGIVSRLSLPDLAYLCRGEGMSSPKVTPGTASAFGGLTPSLSAAGIPIACCADGPSGIRMDDGAPATSLPIGTLMACTWDVALIEELHRLVGQELLNNRIDCWLSPGMNIHRNPLCGRNFEYFSEDPLLTGMMAAAVVRGVQSVGVSATPKHFAANNREWRRHDTESRLSERALREIYLKGFEIVVKTAKPGAIMTSYNLINGRHAANAYDLTTTLLREEWGYEGMVMTDWWAKKEDEGLLTREAAMVAAGNDIAMPVGDENSIIAAVEGGALSLGELQRCGIAILRLLQTAPVSRSYAPTTDYVPGEDWFWVE